MTYQVIDRATGEVILTLHRHAGGTLLGRLHHVQRIPET
jgi:hypothetical protein